MAESGQLRPEHLPLASNGTDEWQLPTQLFPKLPRLFVVAKRGGVGGAIQQGNVMPAPNAEQSGHLDAPASISCRLSRLLLPTRGNFVYIACRIAFQVLGWGYLVCCRLHRHIECRCLAYRVGSVEACCCWPGQFDRLLLLQVCNTR